MEIPQHTETDFINELVENSPFRIVGDKTNGYAVAVANIFLTEKVKTIEQAKEKIDFTNPQFIINFILAINQITNSVKQ